MTRPKLTEAEREQRRAEDRRRLEEAVRELQTSEGWQRWVAVRRHNGLGRYSVNNQLLIAVTCWRRGIEPTFVAGYRWWTEHGYQVRKGERALRILGPVRRRIEDETTGDKRLVVVGFKGVSVFERAQVEAGLGAVPLAPESEPIEGDSHERYLSPVAEALEADGIAVEFGPIEISGARGYFDRNQRRIRVEHELPPNARLRVLLHEAAHALAAAELERLAKGEEDAQHLSYAEEECVVETVGHVVAASLGLDTSREAVPYVAGWGESGALAAVERAAALVDRIADRLEQAAGAVDRDRDAVIAAA
jgi:antirestriction protein ArdC